MSCPNKTSAFIMPAPRYGKQSVPVFKIRKEGPKHSIVDLVVQIMLEGDVSKSWLEGDNSQIVPTETQKNTCYALALKTPYTSAEDYALALARDVLARHKHIRKVEIKTVQRQWERLTVKGAPHNHVFTSHADPVKTTSTAVVTRDSAQVKSGVRDIKLMKTTQSGFSGYIVDQYTNLKPVGDGAESPDRIMCTQMEAWWAFNTVPEGQFEDLNARIRETLTEVFAGPADTGVFSKSLQETAYRMATEVLRRFPMVQEIFMATPNVHFYPYPLKEFGLANPNLVFQSTDCATTASGRIETHLVRAAAKL